VCPGEEAHNGREQKTESGPTGDADPTPDEPLSRGEHFSCHGRQSILWNTGGIMNVFLVILSSIIFLASFPMFTYAFVVPEEWAAALFTAGILTASLAYLIPFVILSRQNR
jgi:hypothetical protein